MRRLEIIHLRAWGELPVEIREGLEESIRASEAEGSITLYRRQGLDTDLTVHVSRSDVAVKKGPSDLALRLASELRAYGLVEHTVWEELK